MVGGFLHVSEVMAEVDEPTVTIFGAKNFPVEFKRKRIIGNKEGFMSTRYDESIELTVN